jgi:predicted metal-dependent peptidase
MRKAGYAKVKLDPKQRRLWDDTLSVLSWVGPGFIHIIYTMLANTGDEEIALFAEELDTPAATDGLQLIFKPSLFFKKNLMKRVFMVLHEVMHAILDHCTVCWYFQQKGVITVAGKSIPYSPIFANVVQDLGINATLIKSQMGEFDPEWLFDPALDAHLSEWVELYFRLWKSMPPPPQPKTGKGGKPGDGTPKPGQGPDVPGNLPGTGKPDPGANQPMLNGPGSKVRFDEHLPPGASIGKDAHEAPPRNEIAWQQAVAAAMEIQRQAGKLPGALEHFFDQILKPKIDWTDQVRGELVRISGSGAYNWQRLDRRLAVRGIGAPGITGHSCGLIVLGGDTSGSIFQDKTLTARFIGEMAGMLEDLNPGEMHSVWCDTEVKRVDILHDVDDLRAIIGSIPGGGGTSFVPVFKYIEENDLRPDALIYLTDGDGTFPDHEPDYPVIWGDISGKPDKYKWGKVVFIPTNKD